MEHKHGKAYRCILDIVINFHKHSYNDMTATYNNKLTAGYGYQYMKCNVTGPHSQQPANNPP